MKICFNIHFYTTWGQALHILGSTPQLGAWDSNNSLPMSCIGDGYWILELELLEQISDLEYRYILKSNHQIIKEEEWEKNHQLQLDDSTLSYSVYDRWQKRPSDLMFFSSAFTKILFARHVKSSTPFVTSEKKLKIKIPASQIERNQSLAILGNQDVFGNWEPSKAVVLSCINFPEWEIEIDATQLVPPIEYKYCIVDNSDQSIFYWESGDNRKLCLPPLKEREMSVISDLPFSGHSPRWKGAGLVIPVFSLRSENSAGIGDFGDLKKIIDWLVVTSQQIVQVLPINDTTRTHTWQDSYPYNAVSTYALHPIYLNLQQMGILKETQRRDYFKLKQLELNKLESVDYEQVEHLKYLYFREIFNQDGKETLTSSEYQAFYQNNQDWLIPYAAYSSLREKYKTSDFRQWKEHSIYNKAEIIRYSKKNLSTVSLYYFLQFHLHKQLSEVHAYASLKGIVLKGDIPIGISKLSVEAWIDPAYFHTQSQAGAPPDDFSVLGQNWGFPTYNWEEMEKDDYCWWKKRFQKMADYFDAYRIDHILGFFRIWEIPDHSVQGIYAWFNPSIPLSTEEIENTGLRFFKERFTTPHINECFLLELFGEFTQEVSAVYLHRSSSHHFALKEQVNTQKKIQQFFNGKEDTKNLKIQNGLYAIANEVLFIPDEKKSTCYHPRITASTTFIYKELDADDQTAFDSLYVHYYYQRHNEFWRERGYKRLISLVSSTDMLVCGEDLGMVPQAVPEVMQELQILSLEIERMPKQMGTEFNLLGDLPYLSVCTTSTHDMSTIREWWQEDREKTQRYFNQVLRREGVAPEDCDPEICTAIISNHLASPSMLIILPLQDWLSIDGELRRANATEERINTPSNPRHYWQYRMHLSIETLLESTDLNQQIRKLIQKNGRV